ncbi:DUF4136 domain-containing protein [Pacificimonas sp. WHA3]|uniref:DUF4136 domain-containing protein n=1 Tax=Pacificimonas pallii TaxID=2827236 RepID=A0ABS6SH49_9SPHN|nr:DUF4136 domain-containing protein [Pacificimonas pallii]MBV7257246.1 DUF4136 domain-containing protein [Pacificimonas pallii]
MKFMKTAVLAGALLLTSACASSFSADVSRFQRLPAPTGESYTIVAMGDEETNSLEFQNYARYVAAQMNAQGYTEVSNPDDATMIVSLDYGVNDGREKIASRPGTRFGGFYGWGNPYYYGRGYYRRPIFYDPFFHGGFGGFNDEVYSYTVYSSFLDMNITRPGGEPVFEGRAEANSRGDNLPELVPNLVTAMFTDFPGMSGKTIRVRVPTERK